MKANELRIGNLVRDKVSGTIMKVVELSSDDLIVLYVIDRDVYPLQEGWEAEPVPLTEEVFTKYGFDKTVQDGFNVFCKKRYKIEKSLSEIFDQGYSFRITTDNSNSTHVCHIKYLHELQNAWRVCEGKELEITL